MYAKAQAQRTTLENEIVVPMEPEQRADWMYVSPQMWLNGDSDVSAALLEHMSLSSLAPTGSGDAPSGMQLEMLGMIQALTQEVTELKSGMFQLQRLQERRVL